MHRWLLCIAFALLQTLADQNIEISINPDADATDVSYNPRYLGGSLYSTRFDDVVWDDKLWTLTTTTLRPNDFRASAFTANGYFGHSFASNGPFVQVFGNLSGWPIFNERQTFGTISGFFDQQPTTNGTNYPWLAQYGWDSVISGIPNYGPLVIELEDGSYLYSNTSTDQISDIKLTQDYKQGLARWQYTWTPSTTGNLSFSVTYLAFADKLLINRGYVQLQVEPSEDCNVTIVNVLDGADALRTDLKTRGTEGRGVYSAFSPNGVSNVTAWIYAYMDGIRMSSAFNVSDKAYIINGTNSVAQGFNTTLKARTRTAVTKYVGVASNDAFSDPQSVAKAAAMQGMKDGFDSSLRHHAAEWASVLPRSAVSDYSDPRTGLLPKDPTLIEKTIVNVASVFALLTNLVSRNASDAVNGVVVNGGISVGGLTSDAYGGQRFWDQDIFMHPYLAAVLPFEARQVTNLRVQQYPQAKSNIQTAFQSSKNTTRFSPDSAAYPWTSGRTANATPTGPVFDYEYHLNGDIAQSFVTTWAASGDSAYFQQNLLAPMQSVSYLFSDILVQDGSLYSLMNMTDPDEYANNVDNGGFTVALMADVMNKTNWFREYYGQTRIADFDTKASNINIPTAGEISLEYSGQNGSIDVKQADVVLKIYPLAYDNYTLDQQRADLSYYAGKQSQNGPGMTFAIFSIAASEIDPSGCSCYTYDQYSWSPYLRAPWFLFSEQLIDDYDENGGTNPAFPFLTGHGGYLQVDLHGYLGLRYTVGFTLIVDPTLPPQIPDLRYPTFYFQGYPIEAVANKSATTLTRLSQPLPGANMTFASAPISVQVGSSANGTLYELPPDGSLTIPNRPFVYNRTVPGNIAQCRPVASPDAYQPGQFPIAAVDGAASTVWQPTSGNTTQSITVDLTDVPFQPLTSVQLDWAKQPPFNATIVLHNQSNPASPGRVTVALTNVTISNPYDAAANSVQPYQSNSTNVTFNETVWSGNYATLEIVGNQNSSESMVGATVAEFAVVGKMKVRR